VRWPPGCIHRARRFIDCSIPKTRRSLSPRLIAPRGRSVARSRSNWYQHRPLASELALSRALCSWRRRSQRAVPANHRSRRKTARSKRRVRRANHPRRNSRPAPLERLDPRLPRHCRILPPQNGCLGRTPLSRDQEPIPFQWILRSL